LSTRTSISKTYEYPNDCIHIENSGSLSDLNDKLKKITEKFKKPTKSSREEIIALWSIQEGLLQDYRQIFIAAQSILIGAVSAVMVFAPDKNPLYIAPLFLLGILTLYAWHDTTKRAGHAVWFLQGELCIHENKGLSKQICLQGCTIFLLSLELSRSD